MPSEWLYIRLGVRWAIASLLLLLIMRVLEGHCSQRVLHLLIGVLDEIQSEAEGVGYRFSAEARAPRRLVP